MAGAIYSCHDSAATTVCSGLANPTFAEALLWLQACCGGRRAHAATFPPSGRTSIMITALRITHARARCCAETAGTLLCLVGMLHAVVLHWIGKRCSCWWTAMPMRLLPTSPASCGRTCNECWRYHCTWSRPWQAWLARAGTTRSKIRRAILSCNHAGAVLHHRLMMR